MVNKGMNIALKISAQCAGLSNISKLSSKLESLKKYEQSIKELKKATENLAKSKKHFTEISNEITKLEKNTQKVKQEYDKLKKKIADGSATNKEQERFKKLSESLQQSKKHMKALEREHSLASKSVEKMTRELDHSKNSFEKYKNKIKEMKIPLSQYRNELKKTEKEIEKLSIQQKISEKIGDTKKSVKNVGKKALTGMAVGATIAGTGAVMGLGYSIQGFLSFEKQMRRVEAISGATKEQYEQLKNKAIELGSTTVFTAEEAAAGMEKFALAGFKTNQIIDVMPPVLQLTAASGEDLAMVSDIISDHMIPFKLGAKDVGHFADVLANTMSRTNVNVGMLGESLKYISGPASALGMDLEQTTAALGLMGDQAIKSGQAGRNLKSALVRLASGDVQKKLERNGIIVRDNNGNFVGMLSLLQQIEKASKNAGGLDKLGFLKDTFGATGMLAIQKLITSQKEFNGKILEGSEAFKAMSEENRNSDGAADRMAKTMLQGASGASVLLSSAIDGLKIVIGELFFNSSTLEGMKNITNFISELSNVLRGNYTNTPLNNTIKNIINYLESVGVKFKEALKPLKNALWNIFNDNNNRKGMKEFGKNMVDWIINIVSIISKTLSTILPTITSIFKIINSIGVDNIAIFITTFMAINKIISAIVSLQTFLTSIGGIVTGLQAVFGALGGPIVWIISAIALIGYLIYKNWDSIKPVLLKIWEIIKPFVDIFINVLTPLGLIYVIGKTIYNNWASFKNLFSNIWNLIKEVATLFFNYLTPIGMIINLIRIFKENWDSSKSIIDNLKNCFSIFFQELFSHFENIKTISMGIFENIKGLWGNFMEIISQNPILNALKNILIFLFEFGTPIGLIITSIQFLISNWEIVKNTILSIWELAKNLAITFFNYLTPIGMIINLIRIFKENWDSSKSIVENLRNCFSIFFQELFSKIQILKDKLNAVKEGFSNIKNKVSEKITGAVNSVRTSIGIDGSHRSGLDYVPFDGYIAELHKGERVLTADENREFMREGYNPTTTLNDTKEKVNKNNINITINVTGEKEDIASAIEEKLRKILGEMQIDNERTTF